MTDVATAAIADGSVHRRYGPPSRVLLAALALAALALAVIGEWWYYQDVASWLPEPGLIVVLDAVVGLSVAGIGLVTWHGRPDSLTGRWLYLAGVGFFVGNLSSTYAAGLFQLGIALSGLWWIGLAIAIVTYPSGRFRNRTDLILAIVATTWTVAFGIVVVTQVDPTGCASCPPNPIRVVVSPDMDRVLRTLDIVGPIVLWLAFAERVVSRWWRAAPFERRALRSLWLAGLAAAGAQVVKGGVDLLADPPLNTLVEDLVAIPLTILVPVALAYGLLRGRLDQASVGDLIIRLGDGDPGATLQASIAQALGDPTLVLALPAPDGQLLTIDGATVDAPGPGRNATMVTAGDEVIAVLIHDSMLDANPGLLRSVAAATRLALENDALGREVQRQLEEVRASRARIVEASDASRARIERDLHDGAQQRLVTIDLRLRALAETTPDVTMRHELEAVADELDEALAELRELARGIHPTTVVQAGLAPAVEALAERAPLPVRIQVPRRRWVVGVEVAAYFVIAEALTNAVRHAGATVVSVSVHEDGDRLVVEVQDDGRGGADPAHGSGLAGLADRVAALDGTLWTDSPTGLGTTVRASFPLGQP